MRRITIRIFFRVFVRDGAVGIMVEMIAGFLARVRKMAPKWRHPDFVNILFLELAEHSFDQAANFEHPSEPLKRGIPLFGPSAFRSDGRGCR